MGLRARTIRTVGLTFAAKRRRRFWRLRTLIALVVVLAVGTGAGVLFVNQVKPPGPPALPTGQVDAFLRAWGAGDARGMAAQLDRHPATDLAALATSLVDAAPGSRARYTNEPGA